MTIIHITTSLAIGGGEQVVLDLSKKSNPQYKTIVFSLTNENDLEDRFIAQNIEVHCLGITSFKNRTLTEALKKFHNIISKLEDVVFHCHQYHGGLFGILYNFKYKKKPIVFTLHSNKVPSVFRRFVLCFARPFRNIDVIFSKASKKWYLNNSSVIPNGVDLSTYKVSDKPSLNNNGTFNFLFLARLSAEKNPLLLVSLAQYLLKNEYSNFKINVVGDGDLMQDLKKAIHENKLDNHIILHGFQSNVVDYLNKSHCLLLPSLFEGMPLVLLEAAAVKLPIIATPVGSIPDYFNDSNSYISDLNNFGDTMLQVVKNYDIATKRAEVSYQDIVNQFDINAIYQKYLKTYQTLITK